MSIVGHLIGMARIYFFKHDCRFYGVNFTKGATTWRVIAPFLRDDLAAVTTAATVQAYLAEAKHESQK